MAVIVLSRDTRSPGRAALHLLQVLMLLLAVGCSPSESRHAPPPAADSTPKRVLEIQSEIKRIDDAVDAPPSSAFKRASHELPHWQFSGLMENGQPVYLNALFTQGQVARAETYYLAGGQLIFVRVEKWWDVDDPARAPEPKTRRDFYVNDGTVIRCAVEVASKPPASKTDDAAGPAASLIKRSRTIAQILDPNSKAAELARSLETFPEAEARTR